MIRIHGALTFEILRGSGLGSVGNALTSFRASVVVGLGRGLEVVGTDVLYGVVGLVAAVVDDARKHQHFAFHGVDIGGAIVRSALNCNTYGTYGSHLICLVNQSSNIISIRLTRKTLCDLCTMYSEK
jgi:hypothetical protein